MASRTLFDLLTFLFMHFLGLDLAGVFLFEIRTGIFCLNFISLFSVRDNMESYLSNWPPIADISFCTLLRGMGGPRTSSLN